jgi:hypothetical protein
LKEKIEVKKDSLGIFKYKIKDDGKIFEKKDVVNNDDSFKKILGYLNTIFGNFGIEMKWINDRKTDKITKRKIYNNSYSLKPQENILPIIERKIKFIKDTNNNLEKIKTEIETNEDPFDVFDIHQS